MTTIRTDEGTLAVHTDLVEVSGWLFPHFIPGMVSYTMNGAPCTQEQAEEFIRRAPDDDRIVLYRCGACAPPASTRPRTSR